MRPPVRANAVFLAALLASFATFAGAGQARADARIVVVGVGPAPLVEDLLWELGPMTGAPSVQQGFDAGATAVLEMLPQGVSVYRRDGVSYFFPFDTPELVTILTRFVVAPSVIIMAAPTMPGDVAPPQRFDWRANRRELRLASPWRLRLAFALAATPRSINGFGAYDDDSTAAYLGLGFRLAAERHVSPRVRVDLTGTYAYVRGDAFTELDQGHEGGLGAALMLVGLGRRRWGGGLGFELLVAQELDEAEDSHFGWVGFRVAFIGEVGWVTRNGRGLSGQLAPTLTRTGYGELGGGLLASIGVDLAL